MRISFRKMFVSLHTFGQPVQLNYKGESSYKTMFGAFITIAIKSFMLLYTAQQIFSLS